MYIIRYFSKINLINLLISFLPFSIILGNLAININVIFICLLGLFVYKTEIFNINDKIFQILIYLFFLYLFVITFINNFPNLDLDIIYKANIIKSLLFSRYLIFFLVINKLIEKNNLDIKLLINSCVFFSSILSFDIIIQTIFKKNLFGYPIIFDQPSSFFGNELIAGGYLQKFSLFSLFFFSIFFSKNFNNLNLKVLILFFVLFLIPIFFTKNRMPILLFLSSFIFFLFLEKQFKKIVITFFIFLFLTLGMLRFSPVKGIDIYIHSFYNNSIEMLIKAPKVFYNSSEENENIIFPKNTSYLQHFNAGVQTWKKNKFFGNGIKSFRIKCESKINQYCNTHPHNYLIEILIDTGIIGFLLIYSCLAICVLNFFKFYKYKKKKFFFISFFLILFFEFFPIRSSGSFFTTNNAVVIFLVMPFVLQIKNLNFFQLKKISN